VESIIRGFCKGMSPPAFEEAGCVVCAQLCLLKDMHSIECIEGSHALLVPDAPNVAARERMMADEPISIVDGPLLTEGCDKVCTSCRDSLLKGKRPIKSLANGLWLGEVPPQLKSLSFAEQMMVARIRHNRCLVRVSSGRAKMTANCIMFSNPTVQIYNVLPPSSAELNEVLAFVFMGSAKPTPEDFRRTPMLVRRKNVLAALDWLKLNHRDYADLCISKENLATYPEEGPPVVVDYRPMGPEDSNRMATAMSQHDAGEELGMADGPCLFTVHGMTGEEYSKMSMKALKIKAMQHLEKGGRLLGMGHSEEPQSMYDNPQIYPQMFPWLFPYGLGGIGQAIHKRKLSHAQHKHWLLMYYDKRFQTDLYFPIIAFNHEQMKSSSTGSFLLARRKNFDAIASRLITLSPSVLGDISDRMQKGKHVVPKNDQEKACFKVLEDLDHVGGNVQGSLTSKKYMRNEIWSLVAFKGAPSWFITFSPADSRHLLCLYLADRNIYFKPELKTAKERDLLVLSNPVAAARFFDHMVDMFIKHVLNFGSEGDGLYGRTGAYYGTVEQQGRLTLHLHLMLWIEGALSPQEIRDRIMGADTAFQKSLVDYLEGCHSGEFMSGSMEEVKAKYKRGYDPKEGVHAILREEQESPVAEGYEDPTQTFPVPPPVNCAKHTDFFASECTSCKNLERWREKYIETVDDLLLRSNMHTCRAGRDQNTKIKTAKGKEGGTTQGKPLDADQKANPKGCLNKEGICTARFPRDLYPETVVSDEDGHIFIKKREAMMNTFTYSPTYMLRCNTDVSSLLSGTSLKAIISYVTDYITKPSLKTYQIFSSAFDVYERNSELIGGGIKEQEAARKLVLKIVNSLGSKMEIGSPAACMYLLGNPDHYKSHSFVPFWWKSFVSEVGSAWRPEEAELHDRLLKSEERAHSPAVPISTGDLKGDYTIANGDAAGSEGINRSPVRPLPEMANTHQNTDFETGSVLPKEEELRPEFDKVVIGREGSNYVQRSYVDDYKYRPVVYANLNLYQWIQCYTKCRRSKKKMEAMASKVADLECLESDTIESDEEGTRSDMYQPFQRAHPLYETHEARCDFKKLDTNVPNFVGGSLPRADQGDREYYCMTMLAIFKPWRSGADLKVGEENWDSAYTRHEFNTREETLLRNFGLKYECLDARDDFHSELKRKTKRAHDGDSYVPYDDANSSDESNGEYADEPHASDTDKFHIMGNVTLRIPAIAARLIYHWP